MVTTFFQLNLKSTPHVNGIINANAQRERRHHYREDVPLEANQGH